MGNVFKYTFFDITPKKSTKTNQSPQNVRISGSKILRKVFLSEEGLGLISRALSQVGIQLPSF